MRPHKSPRADPQTLPGALTGKPSDAAGLLVAPVLVAVLLRLAGGRRVVGGLHAWSIEVAERMLGRAMRLVTIAFSHYCEKARWGLEHFGVEYRDLRTLPMFHFFGVMGATAFRGGRRDRASTRWSTPVLITGEGTRVHDSAEILVYLSDRYGTEQTYA